MISRNMIARNTVPGKSTLEISIYIDLPYSGDQKVNKSFLYCMFLFLKMCTYVYND